ncbi:MAG: hypothetical protein AAFZ89_11435 [Bacteroidota bacterium]
MKNTIVCLLIIVLVFLSACNFKEEMYIKEDGTGKMSISFDGSSLMQMAGEEIAQQEEKRIDSVLSFKEFLLEKKDSIATLPPDEQAKLKRLENFNMRMLMDPDTQEMNFSLFTDFKKVSELGDMLSSFQDASSFQKPGGESPAAKSPMGSTNQGTEVSYSFTSNRFSRKTTIVDQALFQKSLDSMEQAKMFLGESTYTLNYHFPRKIKNISAEKALFSQDGKSFTLEVDFLELMEKPQLLDIEVELEE